ncbi:polysaccharide biosynthesis tyrosine autokinase [Pseudodesulfovibrio cashew]|uniref:non-specific protein-tyrosine kinase n=1 Tax=Pseudodesulfovibrio cashew TaxID=2678688 RepID=A0A6I6JNB5_9BACT|nr:XrtA-associated tyrosine autokinase [Pseudodesulfovibrio cashew]QGY39184.1 polysaccharide biosynthesis tyrosine autokinase [Pseudodesulfovibrio cashew]
MSRIEEALKKATKRRGEEAVSTRPSVSSSHCSDGLERPAAKSPSSKSIPQEVLDRVKNQHMLVAMNDVVSPAAEEFRKLKQNLVRLTKKDGFQNTILITSGTVGEGKSVTAVNLAISLAQEFDHTVLLVDADLRRPSCGNLLCMDTSYGLSDCLLGGTDISTAMIRTGIGKLSFLPAGTPMANPGELLASKRMDDVLREIKGRYSDRYVIIDTPPVLPFAEARTLARLADMVVLVVKEGRLSKYELGETLEALSGANVAGVVYTHASEASTSNRYSGYAKYKYYSAS